MPNSQSAVISLDTQYETAVFMHGEVDPLITQLAPDYDYLAYVKHETATETTDKLIKEQHVLLTSLLSFVQVLAAQTFVVQTTIESLSNTPDGDVVSLVVPVAVPDDSTVFVNATSLGSDFTIESVSRVASGDVTIIFRNISGGAASVALFSLNITSLVTRTQDEINTLFQASVPASLGKCLDFLVT